MKKNFYQKPQLEVISCMTSILMDASYNPDRMPGGNGSADGKTPMGAPKVV